MLYLCMEKYIDVIGYEGLYMVSDQGNVKSVKRIILRSDGRKRTIHEKIKEGTHNKGYKRIALVDNNGKSTSLYVHRIVMESFIGKSNLYVDHINGVKDDNRLENLRYVTNSQNLTFRNTEKTYSTEYPYIYFDKTRSKYLVYKSKKRFATIEQAIEFAKCSLGQQL